MSASRTATLCNALAERVNGLYKTELIHRQGPWRTVADVELATAAWVDWWSNRRLQRRDRSVGADLEPRVRG